MNEKIRPDEFRESMDRCLSGVKADPFLAGRVLASKEGEPAMKRKLSVSLVLALVVLLALGTVAYSATQLFRSVNINGEVVSTEPPNDPGFALGSGMSAKEVRDLVEQTAQDVPDDVLCQAWYTSPVNQSTYLSTHFRTKKYTSYEDFLECMSGTDHLTLPVQPPEDYSSFSAEVHMACAWGNPLELIEADEEGPLQYVRYTFDDSASVITGYILHFGYEDQKKDIMIIASLEGWVSESYVLHESQSAEPVTVKGMQGALMLSLPGYYNQIYMQRRFEREQQVRVHEPEKFDSMHSDNGFYRYECVFVQAANREPEELLRIFNGE